MTTIEQRNEHKFAFNAMLNAKINETERGLYVSYLLLILAFNYVAVTLALFVHTGLPVFAITLLIFLLSSFVFKRDFEKSKEMYAKLLEIKPI